MTFVDDANFIAGAYFTDAAVAFKRDLYPRCQNQAFTVTQNIAAPLPFACSDRNGDPMTLQRSPATPIAGVARRRSTRAARACSTTRSPATSAPTRFATARRRPGLPSNEATMAINVVPPIVPAPPAAKPRTVNARVTYNWFVKRHAAARSRGSSCAACPSARRSTLTCTGKRCPFKTRTIKRSRKSTMNVLNAKTLRKARSGRSAPGRRSTSGSRRRA